MDVSSLSSSKSAALINEIVAIRSKGRQSSGQLGKHLVFSSHTAFFDVLTPLLRAHGFTVSHFTGKTGAQDRLEAVRPFQRDGGNKEDDGEEDAAGRMRGTGGAEGEDSDDNWGFGDDNGGKGSSSGESSGERGGVVMLIALKAGGAGLNLPFASHVWMMEPHWNPYMEDQVRTDEEMT